MYMVENVSWSGGKTREQESVRINTTKQMVQQKCVHMCEGVCDCVVVSFVWCFLFLYISLYTVDILFS